jgi:hypothetical protein
MSANVVLGIVGSVVVLVAIVEMMRRHRHREKYAVIWFLVAVGVLGLALFPGLLAATADLVGVQVPANLLFFVGSLVLLVLTLQHSYELGRLEEKTRTLAEELALLRLELTEHQRQQPVAPPASSAARVVPGSGPRSGPGSSTPGSAAAPDDDDRTTGGRRPPAAT